MNIFAKENKVRKIGGSLESYYYHFRQLVLDINKNYYPLFYMLGYRSSDDFQEVFRIIKAESIEGELKRTYQKRVLGEVLSGRRKLESILPSKTLERIEQNPDKKERIIRTQVNSKTSIAFKEILTEYHKTYKPQFVGIPKNVLDTFKEALYLTPCGLSIDVEKYIEKYGDYMEAFQSETRKQHQAAADAINKLFGGAVVITWEELNRYFKIEYGAVVINPESVNRESYMRLGYKGEVKIIKK